MNYDYGSKNHWRRHVWNRIAERTKDRKGFVLFLAGRDALDVEVATRKGFRPANMIAVERDAATLKFLREAGQLTVDGDLFATLASWPNDRPVSVVLADLCGGLSSSNVRGLVQAFQHPAFQNAIFAVNLLRGRDDQGTTACAMARDLEKDKFLAAGEKHRGAAFVIALSAVMAHGIATIKTTDGDEYDEFFEFSRSEILTRMRPSYYSYKSTAGSQRFDTVVFGHPFPGSVQVDPRWKSEDYSPSQRRRIAATLAHHTMRFGAGAHS